MTTLAESTFCLPDVGEGLADAEIVQWLVSEGDTVAVDQVIVVIETAKAQVELPIPYAGTVTALAAAEGDVVEIGSALVTVRHAGDTVPGPEVATPREAAATGLEGPSTTTVQAGGGDGGSRTLPPSPRVLASPSTRQLARTLGVDLTKVVATGPAGRIIVADVNAAAAAHGDAPTTTALDPAPTLPAGRGFAHHAVGEPAGDRVIPLRGLRRQIAVSMTAAWSVPHVTEFREVDASGLIAAHSRLRVRAGAEGLNLTFLPIFVMACIKALRRHPRFNASLDLESGVIVEHGAINIGVATSSPDGLLVPVVENADNLGLFHLARRIDELILGARDRTATSRDLTGGTFTVTNFGSFGTWLGTPVIRPPEAAIAGFGRITDRVVAVDGHAVVRKTLPLVVAADHRLNDGADLAAFIDDIAAYCADPVLLLQS